MTSSFSGKDAKRISPAQLIGQITEELCRPNGVFAQPGANCPNTVMPSLVALQEIMDRLRAALFPGFFGKPRFMSDSWKYHLSANLDSVFRLLSKEIYNGFCFVCEETELSCEACEERAHETATRFMLQLPHIREMLTGDVRAAYKGDPAAKSPGETIFCYPSILAVTNQRIAHELYRLDVPLIPRIMTEMAHSATGIDIHPGASIGEEFFIDHGTGVVIGETSVIGNRCRLYQGVTLGALSFKAGEDDMLIKGQARHPILGDNVTVYAGATILGRVTIGSGSIIGGNVWLTHNVPAGSRVVQQRSVTPGATEKLNDSAVVKL